MAPGFRTPLTAMYLRDDRWMVVDELVYRTELPEILTTGDGRGLIHVPAGFICDFMSVPRLLGLVYARHGGRNQPAGALHDYTYQQQLYPRDICDRLLWEAMVSLGASRYRAWVAYLGVRMFGGEHYDSGPTRYELLNVLGADQGPEAY